MSNTAAAPTHTDRLIDLDFAHVWRPFTPMRQWRRGRPIIIERGEGFTLIDTDGNRYIDGYSSLWCNVHGHCVSEIDEAIRDQLGKIAHATMLGSGTIPAIVLAGRLVEIVNRAEPMISSPKLNTVFYTDSGATATEVAFKMAAGHHYHRGDAKRDTFLAISGGYHGDTVGAMSVGFLDSMHRPFEAFTFSTKKTPAPDVCRCGTPTSAGGEWPNWDAGRCDRVRDEALTALDEILDAMADRLCALVIEPTMQGAGGMIRQPDGYLSGVVQRCRRLGVLVIADEVATGLGRTGAMLACDLEHVRPDILCLAKGLTGGYLPLAATLSTDEIAESFEGEIGEGKTLYHGHTYTGNPLASAAALASLDRIERNGVVENGAKIGAIIQSRLRESLEDHPNVGDVRNRGVLTGIELVRSRKPWTPLDANLRIGAAVCDAVVQRGTMIRPLGDVVVLNPAPAMDEATVHRLLDAVIGAIVEFPFPA